MLAIESSLVILVPEVELVVKPFRDKYDPSAAEGCPAHVTLLYPFKPPDEITGTDLDNLTRLFGLFPPFRFTLSITRRFPNTLYFAPDPDEPFRQLTFAIWDCYPATPPYSGRYFDVVPHLSVADDQLPDEQLDRISAELGQASRGKLPISVDADDVALLDTKSGRWQVRTKFKFGLTLT
jgi:hypothetical protein